MQTLLLNCLKVITKKDSNMINDFIGKIQLEDFKNQLLERFFIEDRNVIDILFNLMKACKEIDKILNVSEITGVKIDDSFIKVGYKETIKAAEDLLIKIDKSERAYLAI